MTNVSFATAKARAREQGACARALDEIEPMTSWSEFWQHPNAPYWAYWYARRVLHGRWMEAEPYIIRSTKWTYYYACHVVMGLLPEVEPVAFWDNRH